MISACPASLPAAWYVPAVTSAGRISIFAQDQTGGRLRGELAKRDQTPHLSTSIQQHPHLHRSAMDSTRSSESTKWVEENDPIRRMATQQEKANRLGGAYPEADTRAGVQNVSGNLSSSAVHSTPSTPPSRRTGKSSVGDLEETRKQYEEHQRGRKEGQEDPPGPYEKVRHTRSNLKLRW